MYSTSIFYYNLLHFWFFADAIVYMQVIDTGRQVGNIELHITAFVLGTSHNIALPVVQAEIECWVGFDGFRIGG